ncbi:hypothetical protein HZ326_30353 [Fusarium oxysporum f. sp. albedinis]|nr:hypothetical protein HZ326_30353 [Fusarium oxysporum f. sp. albedinis]
MAALETTPTQTNPDHPIRPAALVCRSDEICWSVGLRFEDGLSDGLSDGRSVSHTDRAGRGCNICLLEPSLLL